MKQVTYWGPENIRRLSAKFVHPADQVLGICAPLG